MPSSSPDFTPARNLSDTHARTVRSFLHLAILSFSTDPVSNEITPHLALGSASGSTVYDLLHGGEEVDPQTNTMNYWFQITDRGNPRIAYSLQDFAVSLRAQDSSKQHMGVLDTSHARLVFRGICIKSSYMFKFEDGPGKPAALRTPPQSLREKELSTPLEKSELAGIV